MSGRSPDYLRAKTGVLSWLLTTDHKRIGLMFLAATVVMLMIGGFVAMLIRIQLLTPNRTIVGELAYNRMFTIHGVVMVWLFMIPSIPSGFGNFFVPIMVGAKEIAFPRLNLASFYFYLLGAGLVLGGLFIGGADTGWTFYPPYSAETPTSLIPILVGVLVLGISSTITGVNIIVTTHALRTKGMTWMRLPLFVWSLYATSVILVLATPVLMMSLILIAFDYSLQLGIFDPARGGDPILYQHLFWFYSHPAVYVMILPAMGVVSEVVSAMSHKNSFSYRAIAYSSVGIAFSSFLTWGHHMFTAGMSTFDAGFFGATSMLVAIFSAIKVFTWSATMYKGSISLRAPMLYFLAFLFLFSFGGMTGIALASTSLDVHWHDTYFVVAHFHFIMVGGTLTAFLAGWHYWFPKMFGKDYPERPAVIASVLVFSGFLVTFTPQFLLGNAGMPRRYAVYPAQYQLLNIISTVGSWSLAGGLLLTLAYLSWALVYGKAAENPWQSLGVEWMTASPPPEHNWDVTPTITNQPHQYWMQTDAEPTEKETAGAGNRTTV